jgi:hypothetical protein
MRLQIMDSVTLDTARALVKTHAVTRAVIVCMEDGRRWQIVFRGQAEFVLKSQRQNPKAFVKVETALAELKALGLRHAEIDWTKWQG